MLETNYQSPGRRKEDNHDTETDSYIQLNTRKQRADYPAFGPLIYGVAGNF